MIASDFRRPTLDEARAHAGAGRDETAKQLYLEILKLDPTTLPALRELGALALAGGHRSAARSAFGQAVRYYPNDALSQTALGDMLVEDGDIAAARRHYQAALDADPAYPRAHQGLARLLADLGEPAAIHWRKGFADHAVVRRRYRGAEHGVPLLLLVSARGGNIATAAWIDDRIFEVTAIYSEFFDPAKPLPPHALVVNAIGDADLCGLALERAQILLSHVTAPIINPPQRVRTTDRLRNAQRLSCVPGVITPRIEALRKRELASCSRMEFPLLVRAAGFHTGQHFVRIPTPQALPAAVAGLPPGKLLAIQHFDCHGADGLARKYRVMLIDGTCYPLHLAISRDWKVHYFTAAMAEDTALREEERRFLDDMPGVLGPRAMAALSGIGKRLGLEYAGIDFTLQPDGSVLVFEANATMAIVPPGPGPMWDYRRRAVASVQAAAERMLLRRVSPREPDSRRP